MEPQETEKEAIAEEQEMIEEALNDADGILKGLNDMNYDTIVDKLSPLDRARFDLAVLYSINSYYWMYVRSLGKDTKGHPIMEEMGRIKKITDRIKEMTEKTKKRSMVVDAKAAHRMVKHELWQPANKKIKFTEEENWDNPEPEPGCSKKAK
ncbi:unnamed protein product [Allacma fusca]|uniref:Nuclear nucleic acid-binding protein C1D n=1 Tax=Allacma fusca TaxID=39272 RepID=A0A8J2LIM8_9HEXA|nr:unnamed protein product [Allacma fusca]